MGSQHMGPKTIPPYTFHAIFTRPLTAVLFLSPDRTAGSKAVGHAAKNDRIQHSTLLPVRLSKVVVQSTGERCCSSPWRSDE